MERAQRSVAVEQDLRAHIVCLDERLKEVDGLKEAVERLERDNEVLKSDLEEAGRSHPVEIEVMAREVKEAKEAATRAKELLNSQKELVDGYKMESDSKDDAIKVLEEKVKKAEKELAKKDELILELSTRVATADEVVNRASLNLSSSADLISKMAGSTVEDLLAVMELERLVGLELMKSEHLEPPTFEASVAQRMSRIIKSIQVVIN